MANHSPGMFSISAFIIITSAAMLLALTLVTKEYTYTTALKEAQKIEQVMGSDTLDRINSMATSWYMATIDKWDVSMDIDDMYSDDPKQREREQKLFGGKNQALTQWLETRKEALLDMSFWVLRRVALFVVWVPLWIPLFFLAMWHGMNDREIKKTDFGYTSPVLNKMATKTAFCGFMLNLLIFVAPIAIDPFVFPLLLAVITIAVGISIGNIQKVI